MRQLTVCFTISCLLFAMLSMDALAQDQPQREVKIFSLQHARAENLLPIFHELFSDDGHLRMTCDVRTNTLIASAHVADLEIIEAIVMRLDVPIPERISERSDSGAAEQEAIHTESAKDGQDTLRNPLPHGAIVTRIADNGQQVEQGEVIAIVEADQRDELSHLEIELTSLKAKAAQLSHGDAFDVEQAMAEQNVRLAKMRLEHGNAEVALELDAIDADTIHTKQSIQLLREGLEMIRRTQERSGEIDPRAYMEIRMNLAKAEQQLALLEKRKQLIGDHVQKVRTAELQAELQQAELELRRIQQERDAHQQQLEADRAAIDVQIKLVTDRLHRLQEHSQSKIVAPFKGTVSRVGRVEQGTLVRGQQPILTLRPID